MAFGNPRIFAILGNPRIFALQFGGVVVEEMGKGERGKRADGFSSFLRGVCVCRFKVFF